MAFDGTNLPVLKYPVNERAPEFWKGITQEQRQMVDEAKGHLIENLNTEMIFDVTGTVTRSVGMNIDISYIW